MTMRLTRRGWAVAGVAALGTTLAALFGARALNAVVFPCAVALVAAVTQLYRLDEPSVDRRLPTPGFPGDEGTVTLSFGVESTFVARVTDGLPTALEGDASAETTVGRGPVSYEVRYRRRGEHPVGPVSIRGQDVLGLAERRFTAGAVDYLLVYPEVYDLTSGARRDLISVTDPRESSARDEFDRLREYVRGDSLRDVHWKSSARTDDLVVKEFTADERRDAVTVAVTGEAGRGDEMAEAAASVTVALLGAGVPVTLVTPAGRLEVRLGERRKAFEHLARVAPGDAEVDDASVTIHAGRRATVVRAGDVQTRFDRMTTDRASKRRRSGGVSERARSDDENDERRDASDAEASRSENPDDEHAPGSSEVVA